MSIPLLDKIDVSGVKDITTSFRGGVDSSLKAITATATKATDALTAFRSSLTNSINDVLGTLTGNLISVDDLSSFIKVENGSITFNQQEMVSRIQRATGLNLSSADALKSSALNQIYNEVNRATNGMVGKIYDRNGNVVLLDTLATDNDLGKLTRMIDQYLESQGHERDKYGYYDRISNTAMTEELIRQAAEAGNYEDVRSLYETADALTQPKLQTVLVNSLPTIGSNGDFRTAAVVVELVTPARARAAVPGLIVLLFRSYRVPRYLDMKDYDAEAQRLIDFADLYTPGWRYAEYNGKQVDLLTMWMQTSSGVLKLFQRSKEYAPLVYLGRVFTSKSTMSLLKERWNDLPTVELVGNRIGR